MRKYNRFQQFFTFIASTVIWDGFLSRSVDWTDFQDKQALMEQKMKESLEYLKDNMSTVLHIMQYYAACGPLHGDEDDFTDITKLMPGERRTREEAGRTINELMRIVDPLKLLDKKAEARTKLKDCLATISRTPAPLCPTLEDLSNTHAFAVAEILYVQFFQLREHITVPKKIPPEMEHFIRNIPKSLLSGVMYRMKSGYADEIDSFLENLDSFKKINECPEQMLIMIWIKSNWFFREILNHDQG